MNCFWRPNGPVFRAIWTILYTGTGYSAYLIMITAGGYNKATEIALNCWLLMIINFTGTKAQAYANKSK